MRRVALISVALAVVAVTTVFPLAAHALTADFTTVGPAGRWTGSSLSLNHVTAEAFYLDAGTYVSTNTFLFIRNEPGDHGLGVCSPLEVPTAACNPPATYAGGGGDTNELSNQSKIELIRLKIDDGWDWTSVSVSSLDGGEQGKLLYSNSDSLSAATINGAGVVTSFIAGGSTEEFTFPVTGQAAGAKYLYFIPGPTGTDNDYLVWKADVQVPEPGSLLLLAPAIGAILVSGWRRARGARD